MTMDVQDCCLVRVNQMTCPYKYWVDIEWVEVVDIVVDIVEGDVDIAEGNVECIVSWYNTSIELVLSW